MANLKAVLNGSEPWYVESWYIDDIIANLPDGVEPTEENLRKALDAVEFVFEDKSERNEMLADILYAEFEVVLDG